MALVVLIEDQEMFKSSEFIEQDMRRWWQNKCKKIVIGTDASHEIYFDVATPKHFNLYEGVKRLASFGVKARVARRRVI